jgi:hypothetical protein
MTHRKKKEVKKLGKEIAHIITPILNVYFKKKRRKNPLRIKIYKGNNEVILLTNLGKKWVKTITKNVKTQKKNKRLKNKTFKQRGGFTPMFALQNGMKIIGNTIVKAGKYIIYCDGKGGLKNPTLWGRASGGKVQCWKSGKWSDCDKSFYCKNVGKNNLVCGCENCDECPEETKKNLKLKCNESQPNKCGDERNDPGSQRGGYKKPTLFAELLFHNNI